MSVSASAAVADRLHHLPRRALLGLLTPNSPATLLSRADFADVNWASLAADADRHVVGVMAYQRLLDHGLDDLLPPDVVDRWRADLHHARLQHAIQLQDATAVSQALSARGVAHAFTKGFAYRSWLYSRPWVRIGGDVDLLVGAADLELARWIVAGLGFRQVKFAVDHQRFWHASQEEIASVEAEHYELAEFNTDHFLVNAPEWVGEPPFVARSPFAFGVRAGRPVLHSSVDIHWALHFVFAEFDPLASAQVATPAGGEALPFLGPEWSILISAFKLYFEAFDRPGFGFTHVADLAALLMSDAPVDWEAIGEIAAATNIGPALLYTLGACRDLIGEDPVPSELTEQWSSVTPEGKAAGDTPNRDFGDFVPYLVGHRSPGRLSTSNGTIERDSARPTS